MFLKAEKARQIAERSQHNLFDDQIRTLFEYIEFSAKDGNFSFSFTNEDCKGFGLDKTFWFTGARINDPAWLKSNKILQDNGYVVSYVVNNLNLSTISIFW